MKNSPQDTQILEQSAPSRRGFFMGAAAASAATLAVTQLPHMGGTQAMPIEKLPPAPENGGRSEERRVGKECRSRWSLFFFKQKTAYEIHR